MPALFVFLLKVNIALVVFCLGYYLVLRRLTFYTLNRAYLCVAIIFSTLYPLVNLDGFVQRHQQLTTPVQNVIMSLKAPAERIVNPIIQQPNYWYWAEALFWAGAALFALRLLMQLASLYKLYKNSKPGKIQEHDVRIINSDISPFSFWQSIYINPQNLNPGDLQNIIQHEQVHITEWHTLDILLAEISVIFYWFNPGVWLMKKAVRENIEFITDHRILQKGIDSKTYQYSLLNVSLAPTTSAGITNHFNFSTLKKRIVMMNAKRSSNVNLTRYAFLVPAVVVLLLVFSFTKVELVKNTTYKSIKAAVKTNLISIIKPEGAKTKRAALITDTPKRYGFTTVTGTSTKIDTTKYQFVTKEIPVNRISVPIVTIEPKNQPDRKNIANNSYKIDTTKYRIVVKEIPSADGKAADIITYYEPKDHPGRLTFAGRQSTADSGKTHSISNLTFTKDARDTGRKRGVINITGFTFKTSDSTKIKGRLISQKNAITISKPQQTGSFKIGNLDVASDGTLKHNGETIYMANGEKAVYKKIESVEELPDGALKHNVAITNLPAMKTGYRINITSAGGHFFESVIDHPLDKMIFIDGKEATPKDVKKLSLAKIKSISVVSGENATERYGEKAKNGAIFITTK